MRLNNVNYFIIFISILISIYLIESFLEISNILSKIKKQKTEFEFKQRINLANNEGINFDKRSIFEIYEFYENNNIPVSLMVKPTKFVSSNGFTTKNKKKIFPLAGVSNVLTINCNENGKMSEYVSDRYGFNNKDKIWDYKKIDVLMLGDSFAHGACVDGDKNLLYYLSNNPKKKIINLSYGANGPLIELASYIEYGIEKKPKNILWFYYEGNDLRNLRNEIRSKKLLNYLLASETQNLKNKQKVIDEYLNNFLNKNLETKKNKTDNKQINLTKIIKLGNLRDMIIQTKFIEQKKNCAQENINNFFKIINKMQLLSKKYDSNFYFIYLPSYNRYVSKNDFCRNEILKKLNYHNVNLIDIKKEFFDKVDNPKIYFPFKLFGHYTQEGYYKISQLIADKLF